MIDAGRRGWGICRDAAEGYIRDADLHIEARRRIFFLEELGVEDQAVELRRGFLVGNLHADVLESGVVEGEVGCLGGENGHGAGSG